MYIKHNLHSNKQNTIFSLLLSQYIHVYMYVYIYIYMNTYSTHNNINQ